MHVYMHVQRCVRVCMCGGVCMHVRGCVCAYGGVCMHVQFQSKSMSPQTEFSWVSLPHKELSCSNSWTGGPCSLVLNSEGIFPQTYSKYDKQTSSGSQQKLIQLEEVSREAAFATRHHCTGNNLHQGQANPESRNS